MCCRDSDYRSKCQVEAKNISWFDDGPAGRRIGALYSVYATYGLARGLKSADMTLLRTSVAGLLTLPVLLYHLRIDAEVLRGQWRRWLAVAVLAGPLFAVLIFTAFQFSPPSHGAVFPFAAMSVAGMIFAAIFLADPLT